MNKYDRITVGRLTNRTVNDIETISSIFSEGLFVIISDLLKMLVVAGFMMFQSWRVSLIVFAIMPVIVYATRLFQRAMNAAFEEVRREVANVNSFQQGRITDMRIVNMSTREKEE